jgi:hypothetical protein
MASWDFLFGKSAHGLCWFPQANNLPNASQTNEDCPRCGLRASLMYIREDAAVYKVSITPEGYDGGRGRP